MRRPGYLDTVAIAGVGYTTFSRSSNRTVLSQAIEAVRNAIDDAGLDAVEIDGVASFAWEGDSVPSQAVATALALPEVGFLLDLNMGGQAPSYLVSLAGMAIASGVARHVVLYRALNGRSGLRVGSRRSSGGATNYRYPVGLTAYSQLIALWARRYMIETGAIAEDLAAVPIAQRRYAALNQRALVRSPLTLDDYFESPIVADPFRVPDCTIEVDGACALVMTSIEAARDLRRTPAVVRSAAYLAGPKSGVDTGDALLWDDYSRNYTALLADRLWAWADMGPADVDVAELYDCFSSSVLFAVEGLGLAERGEAADFVRSRELPINTHGGLLAEGYLHGMNTLVEAVLQIQGRAGERQVADASSCLVTSGAMMDGSALVLVREK